MSYALFDLTKNHQDLSGLSFKSAVEVDGFIILAVGAGQIPFLVGRGGRIVQELGKVLNNKVRVIEDGATIRKIVQDFLAPAKVLGINVLYTKSGKEYKIRVQRQHMRRLFKDKEKIQSALGALTHKDFTIVFE